VITLDTSAIVALVDRKDPDHEAVTAALRQEMPPYLVPAAVLGEVGYFIEARLGLPVLAAFLGDLEEASFAVDGGDPDFARIRELTTRYADLPLGLVDAAVVACAVRNGYRVLTLDLRDFGVVARELPLVLVPAPS
jgi:predicted nucleic acid-binding protein